ncbi:MAG: PAS-domain containing protein [Pseudomonadota bacterium]
MLEFDVALAGLIVFSALTCAVVALLLVVRLAPSRPVSWTPFDRSGEAVAFLFEDETLVDATPEAQRLLATGPEQMDEWQRLKAALAPRFPDIAERFAELGEHQQVEVDASDGSGILRAEWRSGLTRIDVEDLTGDMDGIADGLSLTALNEELSDLRTTVDAAPLLVWKEDAAGAVRWANTAYIERALAANPESETLSWPLPQLFPEAPWRAGNEPTDGPAMLELPCPKEAGPLAVTASRFLTHRTATRDAQLIFALPADDLVKAQDQLHEFVQTLTKTFAHLPIGLAVFDRDRRLAMFNPALTDLTRLQPLFLSRRPTLFDFLDQLREARRMPEPKDYRDWKRRISDLEQSSSHGTHIESWSLPDGTTLRVTGRPHPDGAVAFLIQDITSEVSLTRRFRSELELGQAVVDSFDEAIAVFSESRDLVLTNAAYDALWDTAPDTSLRPLTLREVSRTWEEASQPSPLWAELRLNPTESTGRVQWSGEVRRTDGRGLQARLLPLPGNALLVGFRDPSAEARPGPARIEDAGASDQAPASADLDGGQPPAAAAPAVTGGQLAQSRPARGA